MKRLVVGFLLLTLTVSVMSVAATPTKYYLSNDNHPDHEGYLLLDVSDPTSSGAAYLNLDEGPALWATDPFVADTKVDGDVSIVVFLEAEFTEDDVIPIPLQATVSRMLKNSIMWPQ